MITYKASDLVTAAMKLADLENTAFISASENRMYINNAWEEIYQQAIDNGEQYWLSEVEIYEGENELPEDFYQLADIKDDNWDRVPRYNSDLYKGSRFYRIKNDKIYLNKVSSALVEYYPLPTTLDIEGEGDVELEFPHNIYKMLLVYKLAEYYKVRQGGDISGLEMLMEDAWKQFYDMLTRDDHRNGIIKDVKSHTWNWLY